MISVIEKAPARTKQLLNEFLDRKITHEELDRKCAYWYLEYFPEIHRRPLPSPPASYRQYCNADKSKLPPDFWSKKSGMEIKSYLEQRDRILNENKATLFTLENFKLKIPAEDVVAHQSYQQKIQEFLR